MKIQNQGQTKAKILKKINSYWACHESKEHRAVEYLNYQLVDFKSSEEAMVSKVLKKQMLNSNSSKSNSWV